ncbi:MAG: signal peptidase II [Deltaproteobacteria bacterium]|nr:signal peptidase II [Deltaproteobacteria bacterium]
MSDHAYPRPSPRLLALATALLVLTLGLDRWTKVLAQQHLKGTPRQSFLGDTVRLDYAENRGAFLSLGASLSEGARMAIFSWAVGLLLLGLTVTVYVRRDLSPRARLALAAVASGGLGNLYDRVFERGVVTDFMNLGIGPLRTGIFNVADIAIVVGVVLLALPEKPSPPAASRGGDSQPPEVP